MANFMTHFIRTSKDLKIPAHLKVLQFKLLFYIILTDQRPTGINCDQLITVTTVANQHERNGFLLMWNWGHKAFYE